MEITCPTCNFTKFIPDENIPQGARWVRCPKCGNRFDFTARNGKIEIAEKSINQEMKHPYRSQASPWENRNEIGMLKGITDSIKYVLLSPKIFFRKMSHNNGIIEPFAFGLMIGSVGSMLSIFWDFLFRSDQLAILADFLPENIGLNIIFLGIIIFIPFINVIWMFLAGIIFHACLMIVRGCGNGFEGTYRVVAYSQSTQILGIFPYLGGVIGFIWNIIVLLIGLKEIHETTYVKVIIAFFIPILLISLLIFALVSAFSILIG